MAFADATVKTAFENLAASVSFAEKRLIFSDEELSGRRIISIRWLPEDRTP
jgi:hypothetical protein